MATYDLQGVFYEACDCEVICSCWAGLPPEMGSCTGLFVWQIASGSQIDGVDVEGSVAVLSSGKSCDISKYMLILVDGPSALQSAFLEPGAWRDVFQAQSNYPDRLALPNSAKIDITDDGKSIKIKITSIDQPSLITQAKLNFTVKPVTITGEKAGKPIAEQLLIDRVVGTADDRSVSVGVVDTPFDSSQNGLNLLANIPDVYQFDLDISRVTAVRGKFHYIKKS
jgi:Protein of unknown function (DUF1326)